MPSSLPIYFKRNANVCLISCASPREVSLLLNFNMSTLHYVALCFLAVACGFCNASSGIARLQDNQTNIYQVAISLTVALPRQGMWVSFDCGMPGTFQLAPNGHRQWTVPSDTQVDSCSATWGHSSASFSAYDASYDGGYVTVFWIVKLDGFYHSWDNFNWEKRASWEHWVVKASFYFPL